MFKSPFQWFIPREILRKIFVMTAVDIRPTFNGARGAGMKDKARQSSLSTSVALDMSVSLCSIRKNQTLLPWNLGIAEYSSHTMDTDVLVLAVRLSQEMYEVVDKLRRTELFSCNHRLGHGMNLSGTRGKQQCAIFFKLTNAFFDLHLHRWGFFGNPWEVCVTLVWPHLHIF